MASYNVVIKPSAVKELESMPVKELRRVARKIADLAKAPRPTGCVKLSGRDQYRFRQGDYRIVYAVDDRRQLVEVVKIGHRRDVYR